MNRFGNKVILPFYFGIYFSLKCFGGVLHQNYQMRFECDDTQIDKSNILLTIQVRSTLECMYICTSSTVLQCIAFDVVKHSHHKLCRLRSHRLSTKCASTMSNVEKVYYYENILEEATISSTTTRASSMISTEIITTIPMTTIQSCGGAGTYTSGSCVCDVGCSGSNCENCYKDCNEGVGVQSGTIPSYIKPTGSTYPFKVLCNFDVGVTYVQLRMNGNVNFNRSRQEYIDGFGDFSGDFWVGLKHIRELLQQGIYNVGLRYYIPSNGWLIARYSDFSIDNDANQYALSYSTFQGNNPDGLSPSDSTMVARGQPFSTYDNDPTGCARLHGSGWWFNTGCSASNLNAEFPLSFDYNTGITQTKIGIY